MKTTNIANRFDIGHEKFGDSHGINDSELNFNSRRYGKQSVNWDFAQAPDPTFEHDSMYLEMINQLIDLHKIETHSGNIEVTENNLIKYMQEITSAFNRDDQKISIIPESGILRNSVVFDRNIMFRIIKYLLCTLFSYNRNCNEINIFLSCIGASQGYKESYAAIRIQSSRKKNNRKIYFKPTDQMDFCIPDNFRNNIGLFWVEKLIKLQRGVFILNENRSHYNSCIINLPLGNQYLSSKNGEITNPEQTEINDFGKFKQNLPRIVIVTKNNQLNSQLLESLIPDFQFIFKSSGDDVINHVLKENIDLVISGSGISCSDGIPLCEKIKSHRKSINTPVILLTNGDERNFLSNKTKIGADAYFATPFSICDLKMKVEMLIERGKKLKNKLNILPNKFFQSGYNKEEGSFIEKLILICEAHYKSPYLKMSLLSQEIGMSHSNLYRKIKSITGISGNKFIRSFRLKKAAQIFLQDFDSIADVIDSVGFEDVKYFRKCFKSEFGLTPREFIKVHHKDAYLRYEN